MTFHIFCATNLRGECWYIVHYVRVDGLTIKSYHAIHKVIETITPMIYTYISELDY